MTTPNDTTNSFEHIKVKGNQLKDKIKEIIEEGSARRIIIQKDGKTLLEFPLAIGIGGAAAAILLHAPLAAVGAIAALATDVQVIIERDDKATEAVIVPDEDDSSPKSTAKEDSKKENSKKDS